MGHASNSMGRALISMLPRFDFDGPRFDFDGPRFDFDGPRFDLNGPRSKV
jgi:hypothetical protein